MARIKTSVIKPSIFVVTDRETGHVVLTHQMVNAGVGPGPAAAAADSEEHVRDLLKRLKVANAEVLHIQKMDAASWNGGKKAGRPAKPAGRGKKRSKA